MNDDIASGNRDPSGNLVLAAQAIPAIRHPYGLPGGYVGAPDAPEEFVGFNLRAYWHILLKRKWLILGTTASFVALTAVRTLMQTPLYTATVRLQVDPIAKIMESGNVTPGDDSDAGWRTQYELLRSRTMAERVASALKLGNNADFLSPRSFSLRRTLTGLLRPASSSPGSKSNERALESQAAGIVLTNREIDPIVGSRLIDI